MLPMDDVRSWADRLCDEAPPYRRTAWTEPEYARPGATAAEAIEGLVLAFLDQFPAGRLASDIGALLGISGKRAARVLRRLADGDLVERVDPQSHCSLWRRMGRSE
jgi:hypothetical protein